MIDSKVKNKEKRKNEPLKFDEWLTFFFVPLNPSPRIFRVKDFNSYEIDRFKKFGFEKKLRQSKIARVLGFIFYIVFFKFVFDFVSSNY